jgi:His/Glu/Gln/Arg/opine family amino acid ABC transporter permease subunit
MDRWLWLLLRGGFVTLELFAVSMATSTVCGLGLAVLLDSRRPAVAALGRLYSFVFRSVPGILLLLAAYLGLPRIMIHLPPFAAATIGMSSYGTAYLGEIIHSGLKSVPSSLRDAVASLGIAPAHALRRIYLPYSFAVILPPFITEASELLKDTAIASIVGVRELTDASTSVMNITYQPLQVFAVASLLYFLPGSALLLVQERLTRRIWRAGR